MSADTVYVRAIPGVATRDNVVLLVAAFAALAGPMGAVLVARLQFQWNFKAKQRVRWIEVLRDRVSEFIVEARELAVIPDDERDSVAYFTQLTRTTRAGVFAATMLYDSDPALKDLAEKIGDLIAAVDVPAAPDNETLIGKIRPLSDSLESVLKTEWEKAKRGK